MNECERPEDAARRFARQIIELKAELAEARASLESLHEECDRQLAVEIDRLQALIALTAEAWLSLDPGVPWEGAIDAAMRAAVAEIDRLRGEVAELRDALRWLDDSLSWDGAQHPREVNNARKCAQEVLHYETTDYEDADAARKWTTE